MAIPATGSGPVLEPLVVRVVFQGSRGVSASHLMILLSILDEAVRDVELAALGAVESELGDVPSHALHAAMERLRRRPMESIRIQSSQTGSIVIEGALVALGAWLLKYTVAESVKEGYKASVLNKRLADLSTRLFDIVAGALSDIAQRVALLSAGKGIRLSVREVPIGNVSPPRKVLLIEVPEEGLPPSAPTYGEMREPEPK